MTRPVVVITTAAVPGRHAPRLLSTSMIEGMRPGSVVVDLAAAAGGNAELTVDGEEVDHGGVFIIGSSATPSTATFTSCTFTNDSAINGGGALCTDGICTVKMIKCNISNDTAGQGGGVCSSGDGHATVFLTQCTFNNDSGSGFLNEGTATVTACTFSNNTCTDGGGMKDRVDGLSGEGDDPVAQVGRRREGLNLCSAAFAAPG